VLLPVLELFHGRITATGYSNNSILSLEKESNISDKATALENQSVSALLKLCVDGNKVTGSYNEV
jgi:hypothetical protein